MWVEGGSRKPALDDSPCSELNEMQLVDEANAGVELTRTSHALLDARHANQYKAKAASVEDGPELLDAIGPRAVRFVDQDQRRGSWMALV